MNPQLNPDQRAELEQAAAELEAICHATLLGEERVAELDQQLRMLRMLSGFDSIDIVSAYELSTDPAGRSPQRATHIFFTAAGHIERATHHGKIKLTDDIDPYQVVLAPLGVDAGHVQMRPERFADVVADWFKHVDVDFEEAPVFSDNYYVHADDPDRFRGNIDVALLRAIGHLDDLYIEIVKSTFAVTTSGRLATKDVAKLAGLGLEAAASGLRKH